MLRDSYLIARVGGDEFLCVVYGQARNNLRERFAQIATKLAECHDGAGITVGFVDARAQDGPEQLIAAAQAAMNATRRERDRERDHAAATQRNSGAESQ